MGMGGGGSQGILTQQQKLKHYSHECLFSFGLGSNLDSPFYLAF